MKYSKIEAAKRSGKLFTDLLRTEDHIGVVSYSDWVYVNFMLTKITSPQVKEFAKTSIDSISPYGWTAMGRGIQSAYDQFINYGDSTHPWAIVLMSNGWN